MTIDSKPKPVADNDPAASSSDRDLGAPRILVADDHEVVRKGIRHILSSSLPRPVYGEASNPDQVLREVWERKWDLVILGVSLPGRGVLEVLKDIRKLQPELPVLILNIYPGELLAVRSLRAGASGYVPRQTASEGIVEAVRRVLAGGQFVPPSLAERLAHEIRFGAETLPHKRLSDRELHVFLLLAAGQSVKQVAERLRLSPQTVSTHRARILKKMNMQTNADFVRYAVHHRLLDECFGPAGD